MFFRFLRLALMLLLTVCLQAAGYGRGPEKKAITQTKAGQIALKMPGKTPVLKLSRHAGGGTRSQLETQPVFDRVLLLEDVEDDQPDTDDVPEAQVWSYGELRHLVWMEDAPPRSASFRGVCGCARRLFRAARSDLGSEG